MVNEDHCTGAVRVHCYQAQALGTESYAMAYLTFVRRGIPQEGE
jgi:hypothetical protein